MKELTSDWLKWVLGILIVTVLPFMGSSIVANDKESRTRDEGLAKQLADGYKEQQKTNEEIKIALKEIMTDLKYIRKSEAYDGRTP